MRVMKSTQLRNIEEERTNMANCKFYICCRKNGFSLQCASFCLEIPFSLSYMIRNSWLNSKSHPWILDKSLLIFCLLRAAFLKINFVSIYIRVSLYTLWGDFNTHFFCAFFGKHENYWFTKFVQSGSMENSSICVLKSTRLSLNRLKHDWNWPGGSNIQSIWNAVCFCDLALLYMRT